MRKKIIVYGSLRKGEYNFNRFVGYFGEDNFQYVETTTIPGFKLYSLGPYPGINEGTEDDVLVVDILDVSESAYDSVKRMELGAGYSEVLVNINGEELPIYVFDAKLPEDNIVEGGDWLKREEAIIYE